MMDIVLRLAILLLVGVLTLAVILLSRRMIAENKRRSLHSEPLTLNSVSKNEHEENKEEQLISGGRLTPVRILAFSSEESVQCHQLQQPVLRRVVEAKGEEIVTIIHIDVPTSPMLTERYHVLTVPTTVLLDINGKAHSINYGFTNAQSLIRQVEEILTISDTQKALY